MLQFNQSIVSFYLSLLVHESLIYLTVHHSNVDHEPITSHHHLKVNPLRSTDNISTVPVESNAGIFTF